MRNRSLLSILMKVALLPVATVALVACGGAGGGKIMADTPVLEYQAPDADELAGIDEDEEDDEVADDDADDASDDAVPQATPAAAPASADPAKTPAGKSAQNPQN